MSGKGATNPPHINGELVLEACEVRHEDVIELGYTQLKISITQQVIAETRNCKACGLPIELLPGETFFLCDRCLERERPSIEPAPIAVTAACMKCERDLTDRANSDGRAAELHGTVSYACETCLSRVPDFAAATIGPYELLGPLGEGGMGTVYLAYHRPTARLLALKQMKDLKDRLLVKRFEREVRFMKDLIHANIVRCLDVGTDSKGVPFLVTEFVPGGDLETASATDRLPVEGAVSIVLDVLTGLEYLHARKIIHRDIKPQNILLGSHPSASGPLFVPKIADFGLAVSYARAGGTRITKPGTGLGTLMYMPPEQIMDAATAREPADLYAVGVTLYYLLTGQYTFDFPTPADVLELQKKQPELWRKPHEALRLLMELRRLGHPFQIILNEEPTPVEKRNPAVPSDLAEVVNRAVKEGRSSAVPNGG